MKILIVSFFFPPQNAIGGQRPYSWAKYWSRKGHEVHVLTPIKEAGLCTNSAFVVHEVPMSNMYNSLRLIYRRLTGKNNRLNQDNQQINITSKPSFFSKIIAALKRRGLGASCRMPDPADFWY